MDTLVHALNAGISPNIDCTECGNCCSKLMINVEDEAIERLAKTLNLSTEAFIGTYIEKGSNINIMKAIPCPMLMEKKCTVYAARPEGCASFPHLHEPGIRSRLHFLMNQQLI